MTRRLPLDHETGRARRRLEEPRTRLDLFVNERLIYYRVLSASQQWLDDEYYGYDSRTVMIYGTTLRASSTWQAWDAGGRPRVLSEEEMVSRLATAVGTGMYNFNVASSNDSMSWGSYSCAVDGPCVERPVWDVNGLVEVRLW